MNSSFTLTKLDEVKIVFKNYKDKIKKMVEVMLDLQELKTSKVFGLLCIWPLCAFIGRRLADKQ